MRKLNPYDIIGHTCDLLGVRYDDLCDTNYRLRSMAWARAVAVGALRHFGSLSYPKIGACFGKEDHTTWMHAHRRFLADPERADWIDRIGKKLSERSAA